MTGPRSRPPAAAVLVVHGPTSASLTALRRLVDIVGDVTNVTVVAGTAPGVTAAERAGERGHLVRTDHGPRALTEVLRSLSGPVLVLHDDVEITAATAAGLLRSFERTGRVAVATFDGSRYNDRNADAVELACAVADADTLACLASRSGFAPGFVVSGRFVEAAAAPGTHSSDCGRRLADADLTEGPLIVAGLIVRDEEEHLEACLASLAGLVDRIEVADTGSVDRTVQLARAAGANVIEIPWRGDFAWARNQVLDRCRDAAYMIWIDGDERLVCEDPHRTRQLLATYRRLFPAYVLEIRNFNRSGVETHRFKAKRIIDTDLVSFTGALHEQPRRHDDQPLTEVHLAALSIDHHGYADEVVAQREKLERNLEIAREAFEAGPDPTTAVHYARSLKAASRDAAETLAVLEPLMAITKAQGGPVRALMLALRAELELDAGDLEAAAVDARAALDLVPADAVAGAVLATALLRAGRPAEALEAAADYALRPSMTPLVDDHVAARTRAAALFEAAGSVGDLERAVELITELPEHVDPWPPLAAVSAFDDYVALVELAGSLDDDRYLHALLSCAALTSSRLRDATERFGGAGGRLRDEQLMADAMADLAEVDRAPELRDRYLATGNLADATAYAFAAAAGDVELIIELEAVRHHPHPEAAAFAVAAESMRRRGRTAGAVVDAAESLRLWPGAARALLIAVEPLVDTHPDGATEMVTAARSTADFESANPSHLRDEVTRAAAHARLAGGDVAGAVDELVDLVERDLPIELWPELLRACATDLGPLAMVLGLALLTDGDEFVFELARSVEPARTATICASYLAAGGQNPDAVTTGILAAVMAGHEDLAVVIAGHAGVLPVDIRARLERHLSGVGASVVADHLGAVTVA